MTLRVTDAMQAGEETMSNTLTVITNVGDVFGTTVADHQLEPVFQFEGAKIGFNPQDRFMVAIYDTLVVITETGDVFGADVAGQNIGPVYKFSGAKIGFNPQDRFMVALQTGGPGGNSLVVITQAGDVFGADVANKNIGPVYQFGGAKIGFNPQDRFMVELNPTVIQ
jgi:hypothetical protein